MDFTYTIFGEDGHPLLEGSGASDFEADIQHVESQDPFGEVHAVLKSTTGEHIAEAWGIPDNVLDDLWEHVWD